MSTDYHSKYYASELTKKCSSDKLEKLSQSLFNASVDLNPHQIEAALFAFRSPLSRGALLADEVGLGKTIEAGLIVTQLWAERKRRVLVIVPTSLRKQWSQELLDKFFLPSQIVESRFYSAAQKNGKTNPFESENRVTICSYHFARNKMEDIRKIPWDLVIIDEAHRLRNVMKKGNRIAKAILDAVSNRPKVLLTATPLQNNLMELFGLVQFIDSRVFGDESSFRSIFGRGQDFTQRELSDLKSRLKPICHRTLRRQVTEYVPYTQRLAMTVDFTPTNQEQRLYEAVSGYLQREHLMAMPTGQRQLITMVFRKLLASSSFAIAGTLATLAERLRTDLKGLDIVETVEETVSEDFETLEEVQEEWGEEESEQQKVDSSQTEEQRRQLKAEIEELEGYKDLASTITANAKGEKLLTALEKGFEKLAELGAARKAVIFTESKRTQEYLKKHLEANGYPGEVVLFNSSNSDPDSKMVYEEWLKKNAGSDRITGSRAVDIRAALVDHFRDKATLFIATESGAEGINLQFASLVVNYDLPWNPQRIEQRIGRCHRYGQKFDVVVINFLNKSNAADVRVFELLRDKFKLFSGVFGASDDVLGAIGSGVDFEKRVAAIVQTCRTSEQIEFAFNELQRELESQIQTGFADAHRKLMENFDEEVHERLKTNKEKAISQMGRLEKWLWGLTHYELEGCANFDETSYSFLLNKMRAESPAELNVLGNYQFVSKGRVESKAIHYRLGHPLAEWLVDLSKNRAVSDRKLVFHYSGREPKITIIEKLIGKSGWLRLSRLTVEALDVEEHLVFTAFTEEGEQLDQETCERLFQVDGKTEGIEHISKEVVEKLEPAYEKEKNRIFVEVAERNKEFFEQENEKIEKWSEDLKENLERELREMDNQIKDFKRQARLAPALQEKVVLLRQAQELESKRSEKRKKLFETQDEIDIKKEALLSEIQSRLNQKEHRDVLFTIRWVVE